MVFHISFLGQGGLIRKTGLFFCRRLVFHIWISGNTDVAPMSSQSLAIPFHIKFPDDNVFSLSSSLSLLPSLSPSVFPPSFLHHSCNTPPLFPVIQQLFISGDEGRSWPNTKPVPQRTPQYRLYSSTPCTFPGWCARSPRIPPLEKKGGPHTNQKTKPPRMALLDNLRLSAHMLPTFPSLISFRYFFSLRSFVLRCKVLRHGLDLPL